MVLALALLNENVSAGVDVEFATDVVNSGVRFPALTLVTVPDPPPPLELIVTVFVSVS